MKIPASWQDEIDRGTEFGRKASKAIASMPADPEVSRQLLSIPPQNRPGDVLHNLLRSRYGVTIASCKCQEWIDRMNVWTPNGCRDHLEEIVDHLFEEASTNENVSNAIRMALKVPIVGKLEGKRQLRNLVREAITMAESAPHSKMSQEELAIRLASPASEWPSDWKNWPNVIQYHRDLVQQCLADSKNKTTEFVNEEPKQGILIPAGGFCRLYGPSATPQPYFWCAYAAAHMLRHYGCVLPIEFWFLPGEMEQIEYAEIYAKRLSVTCHVVDTENMRCVHGWQVKINAILQSNLDQIIYLDADNIVTADPAYLLDSKEFSENAAMFWGDNPNLKDHRGYIGPQQWERLGSSRLDTVRDIEAGQMVIDKRRGIAALSVVKHLADHADYWGGFNGGSPGVWYGDKTDFHAGFALTETPHWINQQFKWNPGGFYEHRDPAGKLLFQHACHRKGHLVNGHKIQNLIGGNQLWECVYFRSPVTFPDGSIADCQALISPEKQFEILDDHKGMSRTVWLDVLSRNEYILPPTFNSRDVILDIGGNSGAFAYACLRRGAGKVVSVEPHPDTAERMRKNVHQFGDRVEVIQAAVWRSDLPSRPVNLHPHGGQDWSCGYSITLSNDGEAEWEVPSITLDSLLVRLNRVHILKLDCEGSEFPILYTSNELDRCEHIIGEYHLDGDMTLGGEPPQGGWLPWSIAGLTEFLESRGFEIHKIKPSGPTVGGFWARNLHPKA
jgi:FkbM family methyltransferase